MENQLDRRHLTGMFVATAAALTLPRSAAVAAASTQEKAIVDAALKCISVGEECVSHCIDMLGAGKKEMAACLAAVRVNIAACEALVTLASASSKRLKALAAVCADICADCAKECEKHAKMPICKACMDACLECEKVCRAA
jgi:Cys-rich four helix bundle protein (predicted Tat secretion target)